MANGTARARSPHHGIEILSALEPLIRNPCGRARNVFHLGVKPEFNAVSCKLLLDDGTHDEVDIVVKAIIPFRERDATTGNRKCPGGFRTDKTRADNEDARAHPIDIQSRRLPP